MDVEQFLDQPIIGFFIDGAFRVPQGREPKALVSPAIGTVWKEIVEANSDDVGDAVAAAERAFISWKRVPPPVRGGFLRRIGDLLLEYQDAIAWVMAMEMGKPVTQGKGEVVYSAGYFHWFAGEAERIYGMTIPSQFQNKRLILCYEPVGVAASITPWNFPLAMAARKIAAALAAGCTAVNKPSPESPVTMLLFAHLCNMAGLPQGVMGVVPGPEKEVGEALLGVPQVRKLSFTGSTPVGKYLYEHSANTLKKLTLELGGHAPLLVFDDADIGKAVTGTVESKFRNNGETCVCANRIFVQEGILDAFSNALVKAIKKLKIGDPFDASSDLTTILHPASVAKVQHHVQDALDKGAKALLLGNEPYQPAVLSGVTPEMRIFSEETFGPVAPLISFKDDSEGIAMANKGGFGLASYVFTKSLERAFKVVEELEYGIVGVNDGRPSTYQGSFGGVKNSGFGREGGPTAIKEYLVEKFVSIQVG